MVTLAFSMAFCRGPRFHSAADSHFPQSSFCYCCCCCTCSSSFFCPSCPLPDRAPNEFWLPNLIAPHLDSVFIPPGCLTHVSQLLYTSFLCWSFVRSSLFIHASLFCFTGLDGSFQILEEVILESQSALLELFPWDASKQVSEKSPLL